MAGRVLSWSTSIISRSMIESFLPRKDAPEFFQQIGLVYHRLSTLTFSKPAQPDEIDDSRQDVVTLGIPVLCVSILQK